MGLQCLHRGLAGLYELQPGRLQQGDQVDELQEAARGNLQQLEGRRRWKGGGDGGSKVQGTLIHIFGFHLQIRAQMFRSDPGELERSRQTTLGCWNAWGQGVLHLHWRVEI